MKKFIAFLFATMLSAVSAFAFQFDYDEENPPDIVPFEINPATINKILHDTNHATLQEEYGYVIIPNTYYKHDGTSYGIVVVRSITGNYTAFEMRCTRCRYDLHQNGKIYFPNSIMGKCNKCGARLESILYHGSGQLFYDCGAGSPRYLFEYYVDEREKNGKIILTIDKSNN